jgi:opacity protein-like surface antigen
MSRKLFAVAALALLAPIAASQAQVGFGIAAGLSVPSGDFGDGAQSGYHVMGTVAFSPPAAPVGFRVDGMWNEFKLKAPFDNVKDRIMALTANAVVGMPGAMVVSPYLIGGLGYYKMKTDQAGDDGTSKVGFNIGAGVKFGLAGFGAFAEARMHQFSVDNGTGGNTAVRFIPISFGIIF